MSTDENPRFAVVPEPCGTWTVWDGLRNEPATLGDGILIGLNRRKAEAACGVLIRTHETHRDRVELKGRYANS